MEYKTLYSAIATLAASSVPELVRRKLTALGSQFGWNLTPDEENLSDSTEGAWLARRVCCGWVGLYSAVRKRRDNVATKGVTSCPGAGMSLVL